MASQAENEDIRRAMKIFYEQYADGTFKFSDGEIIKANIAFISVQSDVLDTLFVESAPKYIVEVKDYERTNFKLFLDCMMEFQEFSVIDALLIFPIAWKYQVKKLIKKCLITLKPEDLNENVCLTLNTALFLKCDELTKLVTDFLYEKKLFYKVLDTESYLFVLEPEALNELSGWVKKDSYILMNIFQWGKHYLSNLNKEVDLKSFFGEHGLTNCLSLNYFETLGSFLKFDKSEIGENFFSDREFRYHVERNGFNPGNSSWVHLKAGETFTEKFLMERVAILAKLKKELKITRDRVVFYQIPDEKSQTMIISSTSCKLVPSSVEIGKWTSSEDYELAQFVEATDAIFIKNFSDILTDIEIEIKQTFNFDCRILKRSSEKLKPVDNAEKLFFTKSIDFVYEIK